MKQVTVIELSRRSGYSEQHIRKMISEGTIKATRLGERKYLINQSEADKLGVSDLQRKMDELVKNATVMIASPEVISRLQEKNVGIKSTFTPYEEYLDKLFDERRKYAVEIIERLPHIDGKVNNGTITALYNELRECFIFGASGASITLASIMLEFACRERLSREMKRRGEEPNWDKLEKKLFSYTIEKLCSYNVVTEADYKKLSNFGTEVRNNYLHYKIKKLIKDMMLPELPGLNIETGEVFVERNVRPAEKPFLWFSAKKVLDRKTVISKVSFCVEWANKLLG